MGDKSSLAADQLIEPLLGQKLVVHADVFDLTYRVNALHVQGKLPFITRTRVDDPDLLDGNHLPAPVLHEANEYVLHLRPREREDEFQSGMAVHLQRSNRRAEHSY